MEQKVNPNQVEGLADSLGRLNRMIEDQVTGMCKDVSRVVGDTRTQYSEDYVGRTADEVERLIQEIQQLALAIDDQLRIKEKTLRWAAGEYVEREKVAIRKIEEMQQKKIPLVLSREALFQEKNQTLSPFGALPVYPFVLSASVSLPVYIPPLSEELSLNPEKYSEEVLRLQQRLKELGYEVEANGYFDEETLKAVNQFKDNYGLENRRSAAGVVDDQMWRYLFGNLNGILTKDSGVYSDPVKMVQSRLKELGFDIEATGYYDEQTQRAIDGFREIYGKDLSGADGVIGEQTWNALFNIEVPQPQYMIGAYDPKIYSRDDILNRDDPEVQKRLEQTYWATLSKEEQDRRYREIKEEMDAIDKKWADKMRRAQSGIGNQFFANLITGTSNAVVNTINTASAGLPELITEWIIGPMPEGYVDPLDDPYGKKAGVIAGNMVGFFLPFKYLKGIKTPALLAKLSPTVLRSVTAEAIFSGVTEVSDSVTDFRKDGDQSLGERLFNIAFNSSAAGVGDVAFTYAFKTISNMLKSTGAQKILEYIRPKKIEPQKPITGEDWEAYFKDKYGDGNVIWETKGTGNLVDELLKRTKCNPDELIAYLKKIDEYNGTKYADKFAVSGKWPEEIQIPKDPSVLTSNGKIDWSQVPNDGFRINAKGEPIKDPYFPEIGEVIDRYGPIEGRFTSPVIDGRPYSYDQRSLPYIEDISKYHQYKITGDFSKLEFNIKNCSNKDLKAAIDGYMKKYSLEFKDLVIQKGEIAPGFSSTGEGIQYQMPLPLKLLEDLGMIKILF